MLTVKQLREALIGLDENTPVLLRSNVPLVFREIDGADLELVERAQLPKLGDYAKVRHLWSAAKSGPIIGVVDNYVALIIDDGTSWIKKR